MYIQVFMLQGPLFWSLLIFVIFVVGWFAYRASQEYRSQEPFNPKAEDTKTFTVEDLNIQISPDNKSLTIPNTIKVIDNQPLNIVGGITTTTATVGTLNSDTSTLGATTATTVNIGNAQLTNRNGLTVNTNIQCPQATIAGDLTVNGNICIERDGHRWYLVSRGGYLHIVKNDPNLANDYNHRNNEPHVIIAPDGNIWTSRQNFAGWIGDNLNWIRSLGV